MNTAWTNVAYGNPSDGISGRTWDIILDDVLCALTATSYAVNEYLSNQDDHVTHLMINNVYLDVNLVGKDGEVSQLPPALQPPIFSFGFVTKNELLLHLPVNIQWFVEMLYMPSHYEIREPEQVLIDTLWNAFIPQYEEMYT